jgi:hypothetical protein
VLFFELLKVRPTHFIAGNSFGSSKFVVSWTRERTFWSYFSHFCTFHFEILPLLQFGALWRFEAEDVLLVAAVSVVAAAATDGIEGVERIALGRNPRRTVVLDRVVHARHSLLATFTDEIVARVGTHFVLTSPFLSIVRAGFEFTLKYTGNRVLKKYAVSVI